eukprot:8045343-Ditylum_brightwellii.AAC.1
MDSRSERKRKKETAEGSKPRDMLELLTEHMENLEVTTLGTTPPDFLAVIDQCDTIKQHQEE